MQNGYMVISLDFELLWGVFDVVDFSKKQEYFGNTRRVIPEILKSFENNEIHSTWATVGMLFNENWQEWKNNIPDEKPDYHNKALSAYNFGFNNSDERIEEFCFAPGLIKLISKTPGQEIATHTYSHYYCMEAGQNLDDFRTDLTVAIRLAQKFDIELRSLVFPRNQVSMDYLKTCKELGINNIRSNPSSWYWKDAKSDNLFTKLARSGDAYIPLGKKTYGLDDLAIINGHPIEHKASRFLRPSEENSLLRNLKLKRVKEEMELAAKKNEIYHLWWHPHNFGDDPERSMKDLSEILFHFRALRKEYNFQSVTMGELGEIIS